MKKFRFSRIVFYVFKINDNNIFIEIYNNLEDLFERLHLIKYIKTNSFNVTKKHSEKVNCFLKIYINERK